MARREDVEKRMRQVREALGLQARDKREREKSQGDLKPPEELVADAGMRRRELVLTAELEQARDQEAAFEDRYGMTFDEFQGSYDPQADERVTEDYLAWSRAAERVRMLRYELARLNEKLPRAKRRPPAAPEDAGGKHKRRAVS